MSEKLHCTVCNKAFANKDALEMHIKAKHPEIIPKKRKPLPTKKIRNYSILLAVLALIGFGIFSAVAQMQRNNEFAQCLTDEGVVMYGAYWCAACGEQIRLFGGSFKHVEYVECAVSQTQQTAYCDEQGIQSYPTWEFADETRATGVLSLRELSQRSGCER
ncbi:MAG: hypothetical protein ACMXYE_05560 [Candidatus Woesearchaeota archaeon]